MKSVSLNDDIDVQILKLLSKINHKCLNDVDKFLKAHNLTFPQSVILHILLEEDRDLCQKDIVDILGVKGSSITSLINNMSKSGILERTPCKDDARKYIIKVTQKGKDLCQEIANKKSELQIVSLGNLSREEKESFIKILLKLV